MDLNAGRPHEETRWCWCGPDWLATCPECRDDPSCKAACLRCRGAGVVKTQDPATEVVLLIHNRGPRP